MAFRGLQEKLVARATVVERQLQRTQGFSALMRGYLREVYGESIAMRCEVSYQQRVVTIQTPQKVVANDLLLRLGECRAILQAAGVTIERIVVR